MSANRYAIHVAMNLKQDTIDLRSDELEAFADHMGNLIKASRNIFVDEFRGIDMDFYPIAAAEAVADKMNKLSAVKQSNWRDYAAGFAALIMEIGMAG